jgi:hypothetical protein
VRLGPLNSLQLRWFVPDFRMVRRQSLTTLEVPMMNLREVLRDAGVDSSSLDLLCCVGEAAIHYLSVGGAEALALWQKLRALVPHTGHWPVLLGQSDDLERLLDGLRDDGVDPVSQILEEAKPLALHPDPIAWAKAKRQQFYDEFPQFAGEDDAAEPSDGANDETWPTGVEPNNRVTIPFDILTKQPRRLVNVGLVPTPKPWEVPAFLQFGGWNDCPLPAEHVALMQHWYSRYGAEVIGITSDVVEMKVTRPPMTRHDALALARDQMAYCEDIVSQGVGSLGALAATLLGASVWYFWWN